MFRGDGTIPNNPRLPVLLYRHLTSTADVAAHFEQTFLDNGWGGVWHNGIFDYHHFHSNAHEVLAIARGKVRVQLGGAEGRILDVEEGHVLILPAGTGHKNVDASPDLIVVGAYPQGQEDYDLCRDEKDDPETKNRIAAVSLPQSDPVFGKDGPLLDHWR